MISPPPVKSIARQERRLHPLPVRIMHWINAVAIFIMIGSGWRIYNDDVIFGWLHFPDCRRDRQVGAVRPAVALLRHVDFRASTGSPISATASPPDAFGKSCFRISLREILATVGDALRFRLAHDDLTHYNAVQKILYLGIMLVGVLIVISGLALWKPVQFSELASLFGSFQTIRLVHFLCMAAIVAFLLVHVALALLVPQSLVAMLTGGPVVDGKPAPVADAAAEIEATP